MAKSKKWIQAKKQRLSELKIWANQKCLLPFELGRPLPNWGKHLLKLQY